MKLFNSIVDMNEYFYFLKQSHNTPLQLYYKWFTIAESILKEIGVTMYDDVIMNEIARLAGLPNNPIQVDQKASKQ